MLLYFRVLWETQRSVVRSRMRMSDRLGRLLTASRVSRKDNPSSPDRVACEVTCYSETSRGRNSWGHTWSHMVILTVIFKKCFFSSKRREGGRGGEIDRSAFIDWFSPQVSINSQGWSRSKPGLWSRIQISHALARFPSP